MRSSGEPEKSFRVTRRHRALLQPPHAPTRGTYRCALPSVSWPTCPFFSSVRRMVRTVVYANSSEVAFQ